MFGLLVDEIIKEIFSDSVVVDHFVNDVRPEPESVFGAEEEIRGIEQLQNVLFELFDHDVRAGSQQTVDDFR